MISRSLDPTGTIGITLLLSQAIGVAFYIAFTVSIRGHLLGDAAYGIEVSCT